MASKAKAYPSFKRTPFVPKSATSSASKRLKSDGTVSSPYVIDSDSDAEIVRPGAAALRANRTKPSGVVQANDSDSSDDKPLITRLAEWKIARKAGLGAGGVTQEATADSSDDEPLVTRLPNWKAAEKSGFASTPRVHRDGFVSLNDKPLIARSARSKFSVEITAAERKNTDATKISAVSALSLHSSLPIRSPRETESLAPVAPATPSSRGLTYGKRIDLTPTFESIQSVARSSFQRVPKPDRVLTSLSLLNVNKLISSKVKAVKKANCAKVKQTASANKRKRSPAQTFQRDCKDSAAVGVDLVDDESDGTLVDVSIDDFASPVAAKKLRRDNESEHTLERRPASNTTSKGSKLRVNRTARATPTSEVSKRKISLADRLFPDPASPPPSSRRLQNKPDRESIFLRSFKTQWWSGGLSLISAIRAINYGLDPQAPNFDEEEGTRILETLSAQGMLAIRDGVVYHNDQAPEAKPALAKTYLSPTQQLARDIRRAHVEPYRSPHGKVSEMRFQKLDTLLYSLVKMKEALFKNGKAETMQRCSEVLNEWMPGESWQDQAGEGCCSLGFFGLSDGCVEVVVGMVKAASRSC